ncbi:HTH domain-containing protein [Marinilabiliaceae bacterium JC017]|nr:HTH domain-containing protein [Marinilabiliaceae bacterium JC017]
MERYVFLRRVFYFLELCAKKKTGSRKDLAIKLQMSESAVKRMINDLREAGVDIEFDFMSKSYIRQKHNSNNQVRPIKVN